MRTKLTLACALAAFVTIAGGTAEATGLIHTSGIAKGAVTFNRLSPGVQKTISAKASAGAAGVTGATGTDGRNGADGLAGATGQQGSKGDNGANGSNGSNGAPGIKGDKGDKGLKGDTGWKGDKGDPGHMGLTGAQGDHGIPGTNGTNGVKGDAGVKGEQGIAGTNGADGAVGPKGLTGNAGTNGTNGLPGAQGAPGTNGTNGAPGAPGAKGADGTYVVVTHVTGLDSSACPSPTDPTQESDWATDTYTRTLRFDPQDDGSIKVLRTYDGTFTTIAGAATPDAPCGVLGASFTGSFTGFDVVTVTGGHFFPGATCAANCTSAAMMTAFFPGGTKSGPNHGWEYHYDAGAHGSWINADSMRGGNTGNIAG